MSNRDKVYVIVCYAVVILFAVLAIFPFLYILLMSFSSGTAIASGDIFDTSNNLSLDSYVGLFKYANLGQAFFNSVVLSVCGTVFNMVFTVPCAYALSRSRTTGKRIINGILILAMFFRGSIIPSYVWMTMLGLQDSYFAIWLTKLVSVYNILILKGFFEKLPPNILDAAKIDGAGEWSILWKIALPLSKAALATMMIFYLSSWWNDYYLTMIYIRDPDKYTLPIRIIQMITNVEDSSVYIASDTIYAAFSTYGIRAAGIVLSAVPMLCIIPILQKYYINSIVNSPKSKEKKHE